MLGLLHMHMDMDVDVVSVRGAGRMLRWMESVELAMVAWSEDLGSGVRER